MQPSLIEIIGGAALTVVLGSMWHLILAGRRRDREVGDLKVALFGNDGRGGLVTKVDRLSALPEAVQEIRTALIGYQGTGGLLEQVRRLEETSYRHSQALQAHEGRVSLLERQVNHGTHP